MIGVIVVRGPSLEMARLAQSTSVSLLPLGDRPVLQHLIEYLVLQGVLRFELVLEDAPERIQAYLGTGARWGCSIGYRFAKKGQPPYDFVANIPKLRNEPWLLTCSDQFPYMSLGPYVDDPKPLVFVGRDVNDAGPFVDTRTAQGVLAAQRNLLDGVFGDFLIGGTETEPGVRISRNVSLHPSVQLIPPVYLGPNCRIERGARIGPHAVISGQCFIDAGTSIRNSLILRDGYVGQELELNGVIANRNLLVNAMLGTDLAIKDSFLLSGFDGFKLRHRETLTKRHQIAITGTPEFE